ncbi:S49 family peptidase [Chelatococcus reniformis]|uniref:Peptidase S49 n=1 Tax=Chelatococcus reniformis TaxID=1494448 RepID=A0A916U802_9HYPH|nr:S49 family peptidase [Chelatococcus reniformis]GGC62554.1 peptidase S49 [Chelatococcus reniformis]
MPEAAPSPSKSLAQSLAGLLPSRWFGRGKPLVSVVRLQGPIGMASPFRGSLTLAALAPVLEAAFAPKRLSAVALVINSPGGSAAQSHAIFQRIRSLAAEKGVPVVAFTEDVAASGGYMLAIAADEIYADPSSIVGSIGVVSAGFGFDRVLEKLGIERRVYSAGDEKAMLDPFRPERSEDVARLKAIQAEVHAHFIGLVERRRGARLRPDSPGLFGGAFFSAGEAERFGLIEGIGDLRGKMRERFGDEVRFRLVQPRRGLGLRRLLNPAGASSLGAATAAVDPGAWLSAIAERSLWSRYGL